MNNEGTWWEVNIKATDGVLKIRGTVTLEDGKAKESKFTREMRKKVKHREKEIGKEVIRTERDRIINKKKRIRK